jgi:hemolysin activation/secretion protein
MELLCNPQLTIAARFDIGRSHNQPQPYQLNSWTYGAFSGVRGEFLTVKNG